MKTQKRKLSIILLINIFISILCIYLYQSGIFYKLSSKTIYTDVTPAVLSPVNAEETNFTIYSSGAVLLESSTGKILYGKNENQKLYPASTTKILTAILAIENCSSGAS